MLASEKNETSIELWKRHHERLLAHIEKGSKKASQGWSKNVMKKMLKTKEMKILKRKPLMQQMIE